MRRKGPGKPGPFRIRSLCKNGGVIRLRLDLAYDGTHFHGWAKQPGLRTVQGTLEESIQRILRLDEPARLVVAGRTDTGVHARHQVAHIDLEESSLLAAVGHLGFEGPRALEHRLRHIAPADIAIHSVTVAPYGFDARFSALERSYVFRIADDPSIVDPRSRPFVLPVKEALDIDTLNEVASTVVGLQDFGSFATPNPGGTTIREVKVSRWWRVETLPGEFGVLPLEAGLVEYLIVADAFAHNMVRSLVGAQVQVGLGKKTSEWFAEKLAHPVREGATGPIGAQGLTLEHIKYPPDELLGQRAESIRAKRTLESGGLE